MLIMVTKIFTTVKGAGDVNSYLYLPNEGLGVEDRADSI